MARERTSAGLAGAGVSRREAEVLALLGDHLSHAEIAARLFISIRTVESHVASLRRKLGATSHRDLVRLAAGYRPAAQDGHPPGDPTAGAAPGWPAPLTSFVGRASERAALATALAGSRLVSAVGPGGIGKTRLAMAVAMDVAGQFPDGIWFVDLVPVTDPALLPATVLTAIGLAGPSGRPAADVLVTSVASRHVLMVLDNAEHLLDAVAAMSERLLTNCPNLVILVTSRTRLVVPFETVYVVPGLSGSSPDSQDGSGGADGDAVTLFAERAAAAGAPLPPGPPRRRAAVICQVLGGMPLAIELAAARLPSLGLDGLEAGLADQLTLLSGGARPHRRHRSVLETLDWSYRLLRPQEQAVLRRVSVFAASFGADAAAAVAGFEPAEPGQMVAILGRLAEHSLLAPVTEADGTRYHALELVRQFGQASLGEEDEPTRRRHLAWCLATAGELERDGPASSRWPQALDDVVDDLRTSLGWAADQPDLRAAAARLARALADLLFTRGWLREAQRRYEQAADLADDPGQAAATLERAAAAAKTRTLGPAALRLDRAAAAAFLRGGDEAGAAVAFARSAELLNRFAGLFAQPADQALVDELLSAARAHASDDPRARAAICSAEAQRGGIPSDEAVRCARRALRLARQAGDPLLVSAALDGLMAGQVLSGDVTAATAAAAARVSILPPAARDPRAGLELKDALHTAILIGVAAGQIEPSLEYAERHLALPFLSEERSLASEDLLAPAALAGQWDRVIALSEDWLRDWEQDRLPVAPGRGLGPASVSMVYGLRGDEAAHDAWMAVLAAVRGVALQEAVRGSGWGEAFEAIVLLHRDRARAALDLLTAEQDATRTWTTGLWHPWLVGLGAEAAVLSGAAGAAELVAAAQAAADQHPIAAALADRAAALQQADRTAVLATASAFTRAGYPYQQARSHALAERVPA